jgi:protein-tyrosine-phosphatase
MTPLAHILTNIVHKLATATRRADLTGAAGRKSERKRVLFVCTGNAVRSQMAEALANTFYGDIIEAESSGVTPAAMIHPLSSHVLEDLGIILDGASPKNAARFRREHFDVVILLSESAARRFPDWPGARVVRWSVADPSLSSPHARRDDFIKTRDLLSGLIDELADMLRSRRRDGAWGTPHQGIVTSR